ncbi:NAD(P)/FAD-dependent oxidoreductase [Marinobacter sp.]|uniref:flavin-containing monooxygenase n=1 Tax=Marinobacter sp. TaxID=50741 RepID=UPI0019973649|nr:NAD(P)/FAD-dependent oxidoreductase [Marinobacter sp.]MBC7190791.1 NAD(P)/FAD-dependent oxidoreductase [Marinobacter sp.]
MNHPYLDVLIIGAGLSGIGAACHLKKKCPDVRFGIVERRTRIGGTWDLFRYPGIRSDSDMFTLGYNFRPWTETKMLADGPSIRHYIDDTAKAYRVSEHIHFGVKVISEEWDSGKNAWTVTVLNEATGEEETFSAGFVFNCTGYYNYDAGYTPKIPGLNNFAGDVIHPQHWPEDYDYSGKNVVVIGSGATAVTLVPAMTDKAAHVTMLQRSPTYVASVPEQDLISKKLRQILPEMVVYRMARTRNILLQRTVFKLSMSKPKAVRRLLLASVRKQLGRDFDMKHFEPHYNPWEERMCAVPKGDLFKVLREGKASVVTDHIERVNKTGIKLKSGETLPADVIITATGLDLQMLGGAAVRVDGKDVNIAESMMYKGLMLENVPNMAMVFGYTNSSWTLKADIASEFVCRLLNHMRDIGAEKVMPVDDEDCGTDLNFLNLRSGYIQRANDRLPRQGDRAPWQNLHDYLRDLPALRYGNLNDGHLQFEGPHLHSQKRGFLQQLLGS